MAPKVKSTFFFFCFFLFLFAASAQLSGQVNISQSPSVESWGPRIAVDSDGNLHVVWGDFIPNSTSGDAYYSQYDIKAQTWSQPLNISNSGRVYSSEKHAVGIAIDGSDNIYVVYTENNRLSIRIFSGGSWGTPMVLDSWGSGECDNARVAVDQNANIFTTWWRLDTGSVYSKSRVGGNWEAVQQISAGQSKFPDISVGGNAVFACWTSRNGTPVYQINYVRRDKGMNAAWTAPAVMYLDTTLKQQAPAIEVDSNGAAHIVYTPAFPEAGIRIVRYCRWTGSGFAVPVDISSKKTLHYPALAERGNNVYAAWQTGGYGSGAGVEFNNRIGGNWEGQGTVPNSNGVTLCDVATSPSQDTVYYVWDGSKEIWCNMGETGPPPPPPPPPSNNPVASFTYSPVSGDAPLAVTFDGSSSYDPDGNIVAYNWGLGDGTTGTGALVTHTYTRSGHFAVRLTVTDNDGKTGSTTKYVDVIKVNEPPAADFKFSPNTGIYPCEITFDGGLSRDPDGSIIQYSWSFGDGGRGSGRVVRHTYIRWGTFSVSLTVRDDSDATANRVRNIEIRRLFQPLNIHWQTHKDESLFQTRYVNEVGWESNPANDTLGVQIVLHRIWRKKTGESDLAFKPIGEVTGDVFSFMDKDAGSDNTYVYTVTVRDSQGHESPIVGGGGNPSLIQPNKDFQPLQRRAKLEGK